MDLEQIKQWMEFVQQYQGKDFFGTVFDDKDFDQTFLLNKEKEMNKYPAIDMLKTLDSIVVLAELPSVKKQEIELAISGSSLVIKGNVKHPYMEDVEVIESERFYGPFERAVDLLEVVNEEEIVATYSDGLLKITIPRKQVQTKKIIVE